LSAIAYNAFSFGSMWLVQLSIAILPEARVCHGPLYNASSILVSFKMRRSIFVEQGKCVFEFFRREEAPL
jgi:hypothetical protein